MLGRFWPYKTYKTPLFWPIFGRPSYRKKSEDFIKDKIFRLFSVTWPNLQNLQTYKTNRGPFIQNLQNPDVLISPQKAVFSI